jgi:hypothetical protein
MCSLLFNAVQAEEIPFQSPRRTTTRPCGSGRDAVGGVLKRYALFGHSTPCRQLPGAASEYLAPTVRSSAPMRSESGVANMESWKRQDAAHFYSDQHHREALDGALTPLFRHAPLGFGCPGLMRGCRQKKQLQWRKRSLIGRMN